MVQIRCRLETIDTGHGIETIDTGHCIEMIEKIGVSTNSSTWYLTAGVYFYFHNTTSH